MASKRIICTVTNDLNYDQRMIRICTSLAQAGYDVTLVGFQRKNSKPLTQRPFNQVRLPIIAEQGKAMYIFYWISLFFFLLRRDDDILCAIDIDTILPVYYASRIRKKKRVYDAHEIFTELKEVISRPAVHKMWSWIANHCVPHFKTGYTIGDSYAGYFKKQYGVEYGVVRNATILKPLQIPDKHERIILYQGWVNVGRCFEQLIPAMQYVNARLVVCGEGNFYEQAQALTKQHNLENKITFKGYVPPAQLGDHTISAYIGITLFEDTALSNRLSLANRFFDYMHSGVPQLCNKYPEYERVNAEYEVAALVPELTPECIAEKLNKLLNDDDYYKRLQQNCLAARKKYCWQEEEKKLIAIYNNL
ncbi:MAG: glycosyltransferase family 4 protein [Flavipsychrobacter sp.]|jgi:glycosyltransferase involved in cell wall biosynthesis|nr:glycosyltransferase family 4 protein [Flavipsychrobacter sp.]